MYWEYIGNTNILMILEHTYKRFMLRVRAEQHTSTFAPARPTSPIHKYYERLDKHQLPDLAFHVPRFVLDSHATRVL